jgi:hypothetical protein
MAKENRKIEHGGHVVAITDRKTDPSPKVVIDQMEIPVRREEGGGYSTEMMMFQTFPTLEELARTVIDHSPVFLALGRKPAPPSKGGMGGNM